MAVPDSPPMPPAPPTGAPARHGRVELVMGLPVSVHIRASATPAMDVALDAFFADLAHADAVFSTFRADSEISRLNSGDLGLEDCAPEVREVTARCERASASTDGYFAAQRPAPDGGTWFDPSGLVKTWAVERAAPRFMELGAHAWSINAGGDVLAYAPAGAAPWRIGVEDPARTDRLLAVLSLRHGGVATSGSAHRGAHIVDPHTGEPARDVLAVTVVGPSLVCADVYAMAAVARGRDAMAWLRTLEGYEAIVVDADGSVSWTEGWPAGLTAS